MTNIEGKSLLFYIKQLGRSIFTTSEIAKISGKSSSTVTQSLKYLESQGVIFKICMGIWGEVGSNRISPYTLIPFLLPSSRGYVSFISALHLYGIIEQIPQVITVAATSHTRIIRTSIGTYAIHRIAPRFFDGFTWYKGTQNFLIAEPEKALIDSLYLSACKKNQFAYFPELQFPRSFSFRKAEEWVKRIPNSRIRAHVQKKLERIKRERLK